MFRPGAIAAALLALSVAPGALAQAPAAAPAADPQMRERAIVRIPAKGGAKLTVTTPAWKDGGDIPFENTQYRGNTFPGLSWSKGPAGTVSYAVIMQDPDLIIRGGPVLHWVLFNVPASVTTLAPGMTAPPAGASNGPSYLGPNRWYLGPRTPPGPKHHYWFQVFALDTMLPPEGSSNFEALIAAMKGHVLASGEMHGLAQADPNAPPPAPRPAAAPAPK